MGKITQTAGHDILGEFAPAFAHYNDDILFGENWNDTSITHKERCLLTVTALISTGITDNSLVYHMKNAKQAGVSQSEIAGAITHIAFYIGWPKAWAAFNIAKDIWNDKIPETTTNAQLDAKAQHEASMIFPIGEPNTEYAQYFSGQSYLYPVTQGELAVFNVTFEPGCKNNWHIHHADKGGGQLLICVGGHGYYQIWGEEKKPLNPGDSVIIPAGAKHWHGASENSWFSHLAIAIPGENVSTQWLEPVDK
ncbi:MAG: carboxymuconolactone decarboxylase family protein [Bifidobacteriaceae bacterium]|nr:carboxymuconolactone decarboxylase family protein [Bifidobacteriaceae bacterium]